MKTETVSEAIKAAPPVGVTGMSFWGIPLPDVLTILTIVYTIFLIVDKSPAVWRRACAIYRWVRGGVNGKGK